MLVALLVATLCSLLTAVIVLMLQGVAARTKERMLADQRAIADFIRDSGAVTPSTVAEEMGMPVKRADRLLRSMVDDVHFTMGINDEQGVLQFWFMEQD